MGNGEYADGEMHIVHQRRGAVDNDGLAVVGVMLEASNHTRSTFFHQLGFDDLPEIGQKKPVHGTINLAHTFSKQLSSGHYHYEGSLTTPPCAETAHWFLLQKAFKVDQSFVDNFKARFPSPANYRPVQPLNGRPIGIKYAAGPSDVMV